MLRISTKSLQKTIADFQTIIVKGELFVKLLQARCFSLKYEHILEMLRERSNAIMGNLIFNGSIDLVDGDDTLGNLNRSGMCIADRNQNRLYFASEMMECFIANYTTRNKDQRIITKNLLTFRLIPLYNGGWN
jgi:hypothetical protein